MGDLRDPVLPARWSAIAVGGGGAVGLAIAATTLAAGHDGFGPGLRAAVADSTAVVWAAFATGLTAAAGLVALLGWHSWRALRSLQGPGERTTQALALTSLAAAAIIALVFAVGKLQESNFVGEALVTIAIACSAPTVATMASGRELITGDRQSPGGHAVIEVLTWLRRLLRRLLVGLGALVALATLALGASLQRSQEAVEDTSGLLVLGGFGSALVAFVYVPAAATLRDQVRLEAAALFPIADATVAGDSPEQSGRQADGDLGAIVLAQLKARREIEHLIVGEQRIYDEMVAGVIVLGPLLAGALQTYLLS